jgi:cytochrome c-type biogenesis protein CcmE
VIVAVVIVGAFAFLLTRALGDSISYFRTADQAVAQKDKLGDRRFRIEGTVLAGSVREVGKDVGFDIAENGATVHVLHSGSPPELFKPDIPVVLEGRWAGDHYASDRIMVKHSSEYRAKHPENLKKAGATQ